MVDGVITCPELDYTHAWATSDIPPYSAFTADEFQDAGEYSPGVPCVQQKFSDEDTTVSKVYFTNCTAQLVMSENA